MALSIPISGPARLAGSLVLVSFAALGLTRCNSSSGGGPGPGGSSSGGAALSVPSCPAPVPGYTQMPLMVQPAASWTQNAGTLNPACTPSPNPVETGFFDLDGGAEAAPTASGVELTAASSQANCCTCTARSRAYPIGATQVSGTHLQGTFNTERGDADAYALATFRVTLKSQGSSVGSKVFARETRANDNCAGSSELPETVIPETFDVDVATIASGGTSQFDEIDVDLNGYACTTGTCAVGLQCLSVATQGDGGASSSGGDGGSSGGGDGGPATVGFVPVGCEDAANPMVHVDSGMCPNGVNLSQVTTVTCRAQPCTGSSCTATGTLTSMGNFARADCSALKPICDTIAQTVANPQVVIADRVPCN
jgi:hypothetical protein